MGKGQRDGKREGGRGGGGRGGWRQKQPRRAIVWIHPEKAEVELSSGTLMDETESGTVGEHFLEGGEDGGAAAAGRETSRGGKVRGTVPLPLARRSLPLHSMWGGKPQTGFLPTPRQEARDLAGLG